MKTKSWILLLSNNDYLIGTIGVIKGLLNSKTKYPITVCYTNEVDQECLDIITTHFGVNIMKIPYIIPKGHNLEDGYGKDLSLEQPNGWHVGLAKLSIFNFTMFDKIVYLDSDIWILDNIDELFDKPHMSAVGDIHNTADSFQSGILVIEPSEKEYNRVMDAFYQLQDEGQTFIHDQMVIQKAYPDWNKYKYLRLDRLYNTWSTYFDNNFYRMQEFYFERNKIKMFHMVDAKPWNKPKEFFLQRKAEYPIYVKLTFDYADMLDFCIYELEFYGVHSKYLQKMNMNQ